MKKRRMKKKNQGYSLVEMIIVIAIIAVLSAGAMVTVSLIGSARAKEAGVTLDSEISNLIAQSRSQVPKFATTTGGTVESHSDYNFAIAVYQASDGNYYIAHGYYETKSKAFNTFDYSNSNGGKGTSLSTRVRVKYEPGNKNDGTVTDATINGDSDVEATVISFDKAGRCVSGVGTYSIVKTNTNVVLDELTVKANGSHQSK
jgi:prepilin-type N-terminal cleavage/methylation domain-containing protein